MGRLRLRTAEPVGERSSAGLIVILLVRKFSVLNDTGQVTGFRVLLHSPQAQSQCCNESHNLHASLPLHCAEDRPAGKWQHMVDF